MKILLINQTFYPELFATSQQVTDLALYLNKNGHQITVLTGRRGYEDRKKILKSKEEWNGISIHRIHSTGLGKTAVWKRVIDSFTFDFMLLFKLIFTKKHDLVVSFTSPPMVGLFGALFCMLKGGRSAQWLMDVNPDAAFEVGYIRKESLVGRLLNRVFNWTVQQSNEIVVLDRWMKERIKSHGVSEKNITIIPPWSVIEKNQSLEKSSGQFRKENKLENKFVLLFSGNHSIVHPLDTVLEGALKLKSDKNTQFVFSGSGLRTLDVARFKEKHQLQNISQLPWQSREALRDSFQSVDVHLMVMGKNMSGLVHLSKLYSVLSSGKPFLFIGPKNSHVVDLMNVCPAGRHVEHGDVDGFVREVNWFKSLGVERIADLGIKSQSYFMTNFGEETSKARFEKVVVMKGLDSTISPIIPLEIKN